MDDVVKSSYCPHCGHKVTAQAKFCSNCGKQIANAPDDNAIKGAAEVPSQKVLSGLTIGLVVATFFTSDTTIKIGLGLAIPISALFLLRSKNKTDKTVAWVVLGLWLVTFVIGFINSSSTASQGY